MAFKTSRYRGRDLRADIRTLISDCQREVARLTTLVRKGVAGYRARGRADALNDVAGWLGRITGKDAFDFATKLNDLILCLQQSVNDEKCDARPVPGRHRKQLDTCEQHRIMAKAQGRISAYTDIKKMVSLLLNVHYPDQQFPLTLTGGSEDYDERTAWDELHFNAFEPLSDDLSQYEHARLSGQAEPVGADMH